MLILRAYIPDGGASRRPVEVSVGDIAGFVHAPPDADICVVPEGETSYVFVKKRDLSDMEVVDE